MAKKKKNRTNNYPKTRKTRGDSTNSECWRLVNQYGLEKIRSIWKNVGMYRCAKRLKTSPYVIRYLAHKHKWQRPAEKAPAILKGVLNGNVKAEYYKTLDFSGINMNNKKKEE